MGKSSPVDFLWRGLKIVFWMMLWWSRYRHCTWRHSSEGSYWLLYDMYLFTLGSVKTATKETTSEKKERERVLPSCLFQDDEDLLLLTTSLHFFEMKSLSSCNSRWALKGIKKRKKKSRRTLRNEMKLILCMFGTKTFN